MHPSLLSHIDKMRELQNGNDLMAYNAAGTVLLHHLKKNPAQYTGDVADELKAQALKSPVTVKVLPSEATTLQLMCESAAALIEEIATSLDNAEKSMISLQRLEGILKESRDPLVLDATLSGVELMAGETISSDEGVRNAAIEVIRSLSLDHTDPDVRQLAQFHMNQLSPALQKFNDHLETMQAMHANNTWADVKDFEEEAAGLLEALVQDPSLLEKALVRTALEKLAEESGYEEPQPYKITKTACVKQSPKQAMSLSVIRTLESAVIDHDLPVPTKCQVILSLEHAMWLSRDHSLRSAAFDAILCMTGLFAGHPELGEELGRCLANQAAKNNNTPFRLECRERLLAAAENGCDALKKCALRTLVRGVTDNDLDVQATALTLMTERVPTYSLNDVSQLAAAFRSVVDNSMHSKIINLAKAGLEQANERLYNAPGLKEERKKKFGQ